MAAGIRNGNASKAAWICALLIVFVQLSGVKCGGNAAEKQRTLESGIPSSDPTFPNHSGPIPAGNEIASSSHASSRRGGGRRDLLGGELAGIIVGFPLRPIVNQGPPSDDPRPALRRKSSDLALRNGFWLACIRTRDIFLAKQVGAVGTVVMIGGLIWLAKRDIEQARAKVRGAPVVTATLGFESVRLILPHPSHHATRLYSGHVGTKSLPAPPSPMALH
jgi:hypothetical protein